MFRTILVVFFLLGVGLPISTTFEITADTINDSGLFALQMPHPTDRDSFVRLYRSGLREELRCPEGHTFHPLQLVCVVDPSKVVVERKRKPNVNSTEGLFANPENCRAFYNCNRVHCYRIDCPANLLFNSKTKNCDYPLSANCCEYLAKNPDRLVQ